MGNSQSYDVTNVTSRDAKRQEKTGTVKPLRNDLQPQAAEVDEKEKAENKSPPKPQERHEELHEEPHRKAAPAPPPPEPVAAVEPQQQHVTEVGVNDDIPYLYRTEEPETLPVDAIPSQSRYD
ncbi:hypothetical protein OESDEN_06486 [Oesophagostomum dentatum]|uniref:Uncharacterized protein n=1 Tax=Oesophagostomum dentatum TaxID=61180 RepID=A0A0B1T7T2_OESDE|nr:hypothetical protein OESDEN_06486 [Oesophagostomum dentatum]